MTPTEMEALIMNLDKRTSRIEQILPTLATKDDLRLGLAETESRMLEKFEEARRYALVLTESVRDDIRMVAEHLAGLIEQGPQGR